MKVIVVQPVDRDTKEVSLLNVGTEEYQFLDTIEAVNSGDYVLGWVVGDDVDGSGSLNDIVFGSMPEALSEVIRRHVKE